jgi:carbapenem resistance CarG-like protein
VRGSMLSLAAIVFTWSADAADLSGYSVVPISYGVTNTDWTSDGVNDVIVLGRRENFNAHGFDVATLYVVGAPHQGAKPILNLVPVLGQAKERFELLVSGGADCVLHDFRLLQGKKPNDVLLILADRELGESYAADADVTFETYALKVNEESVAGAPLYGFEKLSSSKAKKRVCDVEEAFKAEFGLADYRSREE